MVPFSPLGRSLVIAPQWIGDAVMTEPLLRRLHARGERLTVGALPWVAPVYRAMPQVAEVVEFPFQHGGLQFKARRALAKQFDGQFDNAYVCPNSLKSALLPFLASVPQRIGYLGEARIGLLTHRLKNPSKSARTSMVAFYSALSGDTELEFDRPRLHANLALVDAGLAGLGGLGEPGSPLPAGTALARGGYYAFAPGAEYGPAKRWPSAHFADLAQSLDLPVVLLGSGKEQALCDEIAAAANAKRPGACFNLAGQTSLELAFWVISAAKAVVSNDSGLMHVAAAFGVPQVAIFGSSSPVHTPPLSDRASVLWLKSDPVYQPPLTCAPCFERVCPLPPDQGHMRCLNDISPQRVASYLL